MKITVRKAWDGMVAIRDKYYNEAVQEGLVICHGKDKMTLTPEEVKTKIVMVSKPVVNRFSGATTHKLLYYMWKPDEKNTTRDLAIGCVNNMLQVHKKYGYSVPPPEVILQAVEDVEKIMQKTT